MEELLALFQNPAEEYRGKPFWAWNGKLDKDELLRQIGILKEMGFGGYFMHSRTGLATEYLGDDWFTLVNACAQEGQRMDLESWLYDEDRWPSGTAGGMVTREPAYRRKMLHMDRIPSAEFQEDKDYIAVYTAEADGLVLHSYSRLREGERPPEGTTVLCCTVKEMKPSGFYNGFTDVDRLNREATEEFIRSTHQRYREECGDRLGRSISGIFTDEPHRGELMSTFGGVAEDPEWCVPWSAGLPTFYQSLHGYDLLERLPELFFWYKGEKVSPVKWQFVEALQQLFLRNFAKPVQDWCRANGLKLTGHILHEDSLAAQTAVSGSVMRYYEYMDCPGVDVLTEHNRSYWIVKQLTSAARQLGKKQLLSELYGCTGWQFTFESHKKVGDWQAFFGINLRCPHLSWYTMGGEAKRDYPGSIFYQSAWWKDYAYVESYFARLAVMMNRGEPCCEVLVLNPVESVWSRVYPGWCEGLDGRDPEVVKLEETYEQVLGWLCGGRIDFDYGDEDMLLRLGHVEKVGGETILRVGKAVYRKVLVAGLDTIRSATLTLLREFRKQGGLVVFAGRAPRYVDAKSSGECSAFADSCHHTPLDPSLAGALAPENPVVTVKGRDGEALPDIYLQLRRDGGETIILLWNSDPDKRHDGVSVTIHRDGILQEWDCETGACCPIAVCDGEQTEVSLDFAGSQWHLLTVSLGLPAKLAIHAEKKAVNTKKLKGPFPYTLDEANVCVLDFASCRVDNESLGEDEILKLDRAIRRRFHLPYRGGEMVQPWYAGEKSAETLGRVELCFEFYVESCPSGQVQLAMETPHRFAVCLNGQQLGLQPSGYWIDPCFRTLDLPDGILQLGRNELLLSADFSEELNLETVYLLGNFGVQIGGRKKSLTELPKTLRVGDIAHQGLPFYSGKITYQTGFMIPSESPTSVVCKDFGGACVRAVCGGTGRMIAWEPFEADLTGLEGELLLELVLTRRNTFGPLHELPLHAPYCAPESFVTEGDHFSADYQLIPAGLLEEPLLCRCEEGSNIIFTDSKG